MPERRVPRHPRCSAVSLSLNEPQFATASVVRRWIMLEQPGPWGYHALTESRLGPAIARQLLNQTRRLGVRLVLIRRRGRLAPGRRHCFFASTEEAGGWIRHAWLKDPEELLAVDLRPLARGEPPSLGQPHPLPLYLICTNGRRDPCCAERGRPTARSLVRAVGERAWECSHIGGDRFAGNLVCLPDGVYFGRVGPDEAAPLAEWFERGLIDLNHYRGRICYAFPVQAAEYFVRRVHSLSGVHDLRLIERRRIDGGSLEAAFEGLDGRLFRVEVRTGAAQPPRALTCYGPEGARPPTYDLVRLSVT